MNKIGTKDVFLYFWKQLLTSKVYFTILIISVVSVGIISLSYPIFYKEIIDIATNSSMPRELIIGKLTNIFLCIVGVGFTNWLLRRVLEYVIVKLEIGLMGKIYLESFNYVHRHSYRFFTNNFSGSLVKRIGRLVGSIESFIDLFVFEIIRLSVGLTFISGYLLYQNIYLGFMFIGWIVVFSIVSYVLNKKRLPVWEAAVKEETKLSGFLADTITNNYNILVFGALGKEFTNFVETTLAWQTITRKSWFFNNVAYAILGGLSMSIEFAMIYLAIYLWYTGYITIGTFVLLVSYQLTISSQLGSIGHIFRKLNTIVGNSIESLEMLNAKHEIVDRPDAKNLIVDKGAIEFSNISFSYTQGVNIFDNLNIKVGAGEKVALVGHSGSGKSTIIKLLFRFFELNGGEILIDGQDISKVKQDSLRKSIAMVPQDSILFHRSLSENIAYAKPNATMEEIINASKLAHCDDFISKFPKGYDTLVGERGIKLSGGERQRVAIARALLSDAKILVLDEATSSLDSESESLIQDAIENMLGNKTTIVIAHRLSTIMKMDRIIVLDQGKIVEEGTHDDLIKIEGGMYRNLWEIQSGGFISE